MVLGMIVSLLIGGVSKIDLNSLLHSSVVLS